MSLVLVLGGTGSIGRLVVRRLLELGDRAGVVPQQCGAYHPPVLVEADHCVLLTTDGNGADVTEAARFLDRGKQLTTRPLVDLGAGRVRG